MVRKTTSATVHSPGNPDNPVHNPENPDNPVHNPENPDNHVHNPDNPENPDNPVNNPDNPVHNPDKTTLERERCGLKRRPGGGGCSRIGNIPPWIAKYITTHYVPIAPTYSISTFSYNL